MSCCCNSVPTLGVSTVNISGTTATINLTGALPVSGKFNVRICGNCLDVCSGASVILTDAAGTTIKTVLDKCGDPVLLNKVACQARKHRVLHFCRSVGTNTAILQDSICAPTPVVTATPAASASTRSSGKE